MAPIDRVAAAADSIPTDASAADGTATWNETVLVLVEVGAGATSALGYTYADPATARFIDGHLAPIVVGCDALDVPAIWVAMCQRVRNLRPPRGRSDGHFRGGHLKPAHVRPTLELVLV